MPPLDLGPLPSLPWKEGIELVLARYERKILDHALEQSGNVKRRAALLLGISRYALERRLTRVDRILENPELAGLDERDEPPPLEHRAAAGE